MKEVEGWEGLERRKGEIEIRAEIGKKREDWRGRSSSRA